MPDFNPLFAPLLLPLPLPVINEDNENNLGPLAGVPLLQWVPWPEAHFGAQITNGAALNHGLLTPPLTPLPQFLENVQELPNVLAPGFILPDDVQDGQFVQDIPNFNEGMGEDPNDEFIYGPLDPVAIEVDNALEEGPVGFDINLLFDEFHAIFDAEDGENDVANEEVAHADLIINGLFFETVEEEESGDDGDDMELDEVDSLL
ncbi:hypothetical protein ACEPAF_7799 [Sanghuangporus sanghuang]